MKIYLLFKIFSTLLLYKREKTGNKKYNQYIVEFEKKIIKLAKKYLYNQKLIIYKFSFLYFYNFFLFSKKRLYWFSYATKKRIINS